MGKQDAPCDRVIWRAVRFVGREFSNAGNIITEGCLMAEELNVHFRSSVQCSRGKILVRYLYQKQSSMDQRRKSWGS